MWKVALRRKQSTHLYNYVIMLLQEHLFSELCVLFFLNTLRYNFKTNKMCYFMGDSSMHFDKLMCALSHFSHVWFCATLWTIASQAPLSMGFSRQECWSGLPRPPPGGSSWCRDQPHISYISCTGRQVLYHFCHLGSPCIGPIAD